MMTCYDASFPGFSRQWIENKIEWISRNELRFKVECVVRLFFCCFKGEFSNHNSDVQRHLFRTQVMQANHTSHPREKSIRFSSSIPKAKYRTTCTSVKSEELSPHLTSPAFRRISKQTHETLCYSSGLYTILYRYLVWIGFLSFKLCPKILQSNIKYWFCVT